MPHHNHFNLFNRWKYESDEIGAIPLFKDFETREGQLNQHLSIMMWKLKIDYLNFHQNRY